MSDDVNTGEILFQLLHLMKRNNPYTWLTCFVLMQLSVTVTAQTTKADENVVIKSKKELYEFATGSAENPVVIQQQFNTVYRCDGFRTTVPYVEFYDDKSTIGEVSVSIDGKKAKHIKPTFDYYSIENIFYSDARVCYLKFPLEKKGSESEVSLSKTVLDPRYFTTIYLTETFKTENKQVTVTVPSWMKVELKEMNFAGYNIQKQVQKNNGNDVYTYTIVNQEAKKAEPRSPGPSYIYPHLLVLCKYATIPSGKITYFNTVNDQYAWYRQLVLQVANDKAIIKQKAQEIIKGAIDDLEKTKLIFNYVQDNIRYIAFEDGIAGFKPENAQSVLQKKYGDCKGMANLTKELLVSVGLDARLCWIGTNHIAYDYSTPSMSVDNHMICALNYKGKFYFLDATETYIGFDQYAERIQGRQVLIENGDQFVLERIPLRASVQNTDYEKRSLTVDGASLLGNVTHKWQGESKEWLLTQIHGMRKDKLSDALEYYLSENNQKYSITGLKTSDLQERNNDLDISYNVSHRESVASFGDELYIEMDFRKDMDNAEIKIDERKQDWRFPYKQHLVYETELTIPKGYKISQLPSGISIDDAGYAFKVAYTLNGEKLLYRKEILIKNTALPKKQFGKWNESIQQLKKCYNEQVTLVKN